MTLQEWRDFAEIASNIVVALSASAGGIWAIARYIRERTDEAALDIGIGCRSVAQSSEHLVMLDVALTNKGKTKLQAKTSRNSNGFAYSDGVEQLQYSCSLQLRQVQAWKANSNRHLDWFDSTLLQPVPGLNSAINLMTEYENPQKGNIVDFWMEPGEVYHIGATMVLPVGQYLVKVTFIGEAGDDNFWSRVAAIAVPNHLANSS